MKDAASALSGCSMEVVFASSLYVADLPGPLPTPWNAGFIDMQWATEDFNKTEVR